MGTGYEDFVSHRELHTFDEADLFIIHLCGFSLRYADAVDERAARYLATNQKLRQPKRGCARAGGISDSRDSTSRC